MLLLILITSTFACILETSVLPGEGIDVEKSTSITSVDSDVYMIQEESCELFKITSDGNLEELSGECDYDDLTTIFQHPDLNGQTSADPTLIACRKNGKKCVRLGTSSTYTVQDGGDGCHDSVNWVTADVEGAFGVQQNGREYMVALIGSQLITYEILESTIESVGCSSVTAPFSDVSGVSLFGSTVAISSQTSNQLWIGEGAGIPFALTGNGQTFPIGNVFERVSGIVLQAVDSSGNVNGFLSGDHVDGDNALLQFALSCSAGDDYASPVSSCHSEADLVLTVESCQTTAASLGLGDVVATSISRSDRPKGCYYKPDASSANSKLYFNSAGTFTPSVDSTRSSICIDRSPDTTEETTTTTGESTTTTEESMTTAAQTTSSSVVETTSSSTASTTTEEALTTVDSTSEGSTEDEATTSDALTTLESTTIDDLGQSTTEINTSSFTTAEEIVTTMDAGETTVGADETTSAAVLSTTGGADPIDDLTTGTEETTAEELTTEEPEQFVGFSLSSVSRCRLSSQVLLTEVECSQAATDLFLSDTTPQQIQNEERPYGCYFKEDAKQEDGKLWLNTHPSAESFEVDPSRQSLCRGDGALTSRAPTLVSSLGLMISLVVFFL